MGGVCWDDPAWRAHEAAQLRRYMAGRAAEAVIEPALAAASRSAERGGPEAQAKVARLLREQPNWDRYYREVEGC